MKEYWSSVNLKQFTIIVFLSMPALLMGAVWTPSFAQQPAETNSYPQLDSLQIPGKLKPANLNPSSLGLAEAYLEELASKRGRQRKIRGGLGLGFGLVLTVIGGAMLSEVEGGSSFDDSINAYYGQYYLVYGISSALMGTINLAVPSPQERSYRKVLGNGDQLEREQQAEEQLFKLAKKARVNRLIGSVITGTGLAYLLFSNDTSSDMDFFIPVFAGSLIFSIARKSLEERTLQSYLEEKKRRWYPGSNFSLEVGAGPTAAGGGVVQMRFNF